MPNVYAVSWIANFIKTALMSDKQCIHWNTLKFVFGKTTKQALSSFEP